MESLFIIRNQNNQFLTRHNEWVNREATVALFRTPHKDVALNQIIEMNAKFIDLRCEIISCPTDDKGLPIIPDLASFAGSAPFFPISTAAGEKDLLDENDAADALQQTLTGGEESEVTTEGSVLVEFSPEESMSAEPLHGHTQANAELI